MSPRGRAPVKVMVDGSHGSRGQIGKLIRRADEERWWVALNGKEYRIPVKALELVRRNV